MKGHCRGQQGAILVLTAFLLPFIILFTGFAVDVGNAYVHHSKLQNSVDAAALAGGHKYAENNNTADINSKINEYMKLNQGQDSYNIDNISYEWPNNDTMDITVDASEKVPIFFLGAALKLLHVDITDEEAENWKINVSAKVRVSSDSKKEDTVPDIFKYAMIGGYSGPFKGNTKGNPRNHEINNALTFDNTNLRVKGNVHTNGAIFMNNTAAATLEHLSSAAKTDDQLWSGYRDDYWSHYLNSQDAYYKGSTPIFYDTLSDEIYKQHIAPGHEHDQKVDENTPWSRRGFTWRYYYRAVYETKDNNGNTQYKDYLAEETNNKTTPSIDISLSNSNSETKELYDLIYNQYMKMDKDEQVKNHIFVGEKGAFNYNTGNKNINEYPYLTQEGSSGDTKDFYRIIITQGDLTIDFDNVPSPKSDNEHVLLISLNGNIELHGNTPIYGYLYAPNGTIYMDGLPAVYGSMVAKSIYVDSSNAYIENKIFNGGNSGNSGSSSLNPTVKLIG